MKTKSWTGSADAGFIEDVMTLSSKIRLTTDETSQTLGLIYAIYMMQVLAESKTPFVAFDEEGKEIAMYNKSDGKIAAKSELHDAVSSMYHIINRERDSLRADLFEELRVKYGLEPPDSK